MRSLLSSATPCGQAGRIGRFSNASKSIGGLKMKRLKPTLFFFWVAMTVIFSAAASADSLSAQLPFSKAKIIFEFNSSGPDLGIQVSLDGEPWNEIKIVDPQGRT